MEDVMNVTATTYPETYVREMHGEELKTILESVADNLYHPDPYYQQGGDMVRVGGMDYTLEPTSTFGTRIADMRLDSGKSIESNKRYTVAGWSTANPSDGPPMWEIMASYLRTQKTISVKKVNLPKLKGVANNSGIADYPKNLLVT
jgi:sulfur-oxidizing protein SoxB